MTIPGLRDRPFIDGKYVSGKGKPNTVTSPWTNETIATVSTVDGKDAERALEEAGMTVNKNTVPGETRSPFVTSGLRIGTPALTTQGMREPEMLRIADWISDILERPGDTDLRSQIRAEVSDMTRTFPLYPDLASVGA